MSDDWTIQEYLEDLRGRIQIKLARGGAPADAETLRLICLAVALRVADPYNLKSFITPPHIYDRAQALLTDVDRDFAVEISDLRDVIADAQEDPAWHASVEEGKRAGDIPSNSEDRETIAQMILGLLLSLDDE